MSQEDYDQLRMTGEVPPTSETFISPTQSFSDDYDGVTVEFKLNQGTTSQLESIGVRDNSNLTGRTYPDMPSVKTADNWTVNNAYFKGEDDQINIGLGRGAGREIFNSNISSYKRVGGSSQ